MLNGLIMQPSRIEDIKRIKLLLFSLFFFNSFAIMAQDNGFPSTYVVSISRLNVRSGPSANSKVLGVLTQGEKVMVYSINKGWANIEFKEKKAYISIKYIEKVELPPEIVETIEPVEETVEQESEPILVDTIEHKTSIFSKFHFKLTSTLSLGVSNLYSFSAHSRPRFGIGIDVGTQITTEFMPNKMFSEITTGFILLGNSRYSFPSFSINILPIGYRSSPISLWKFQNVRYYAIGGLSFLFSGGGIYFSQNSMYYSYYSKPTTNLYVKGGLEIKDSIAVGFLFMHGLDNVCHDLPIGLKHSAFQIYGSFLFDKWKKGNEE